MKEFYNFLNVAFILVIFLEMAILKMFYRTANWFGDSI